MDIDLLLIWTVIIISDIMIYVMMDGFDLGIGVLCLFLKDNGNRGVMMNTMTSVWDDNETWLVLGGTALFRAFPLAHAVALSALCLPLIFMLVELISRNVAFEFRFETRPAKQHIWDRVFIGGSLAATLFQGMVLGAFIEGIPVENHSFTGGPLDWIAPFPLFCGLALVVTYALLGCTWLIMRTKGRLQERMHDPARPLALVLLAIIGVVSPWTLLAHIEIAVRWFSLPNLFWFLPVSILILVTFYALLRSAANNDHAKPFVLTLMLIFLGYSGLGIGLWPNITPSVVNIQKASTLPQSQGFVSVGALSIIPFILGYVAQSCYVFRGKVKRSDGYR